MAGSVFPVLLGLGEALMPKILDGTWAPHQKLKCDEVLDIYPNVPSLDEYGFTMSLSGGQKGGDGLCFELTLILIIVIMAVIFENR